MPRPVWTGSISFGLVNIPVKLFSATEAHRVAFHEFEEGSGQRIRLKRVAEGSGHEVIWERIQKGFEVAKDRYVMLTDEELEAAEPRKTHTVDIEHFVPLTDIDPVSWDQSYYATPDGEAAGKAYALLREAMQKAGRVAVGRFVMRTKEYVVCIRPLEKVLAVQTMFFPDEVRSTRDLGDVPGKGVVNARELTMAAQLIDTLAGRWDPKQYQDTFRERVLALVKKKDKGEVIESGPKEERGGGQVVDLMAALKATLDGHASAGKATTSVARRATTSVARKATTPAARKAPARRAAPATRRAKPTPARKRAHP
jgi:DNA end-binding protein Ku